MEDLRILVIGDQHFKINNIQQMEQFCDKIIQFVKSRLDDIDVIVCLGDALDRHESINVFPQVLCTEFFGNLSDLKPLYILIGNHDRPNNSDFLSKYHPFTALHRWNNTKIADTVLIEVIKGHKFVCVPYVPNGRFKEALNTKLDNYDDITAIFAHQDFFGAQMGSVTSANGDKWQLDNPLVISGHIHEYHKPQKNILYIGTPHQINFSSESIIHTISIFTFTKSNDNRNKNYQEERINLELTKKVIITVPCTCILTWVPPTNCIIKLVLEGTSPEIKATMKLDYVKELTKKGITIVYKTLEDNKVGDIKLDDIKLDDININQPKDKVIPYLSKLNNMIQTDASQKEWFIKIFGNIEV